MSWKTITKALSHTDVIALDEGSYKIVLIRPAAPDDRLQMTPSIITKNVGSLLHEQDSVEGRQNARQLYLTLRADPLSRGTTGKLLEPPFYALCMQGASFQLVKMALKPGGRTLNTYTNAASGATQSLTFATLQRIMFDRDHPIQTIKAGYYYQPRHRTQSSESYDSFVYDPEQLNFTLFQSLRAFATTSR
jgi:hypothetical protein